MNCRFADPKIPCHRQQCQRSCRPHHERTCARWMSRGAWSVVLQRRFSGGIGDLTDTKSMAEKAVYTAARVKTSASW